MDNEPKRVGIPGIKLLFGGGLMAVAFLIATLIYALYAGPDEPANKWLIGGATVSIIAMLIGLGQGFIEMISRIVDK